MHSAVRGLHAVAVPLPLRRRLRQAPPEGRARPCPNSSRRSGSTSATSSGGHPGLQVPHLARAPGARRDARQHALRPRARPHPDLGQERYLPLLAGPPRRASTDAPWSRSSTGLGPPATPPRTPAAHPRRSPPRPAEPEVHLRAVRDRRAATASPTPPRWPWRSCPPRPTTRSSSTARPGSARPTSSTPSATTSGATGRAARPLRDRRGVHERVRRGRPRSGAPAIQGPLPRGGRGADRRRPVPRRRKAKTARGVLPHLQRALRVRPPAGDHLRPPSRRAAGPRGRAWPSASAPASWSSSSHPASRSRRAILRKRARLDGVAVSDEVLDEIAGRVTSSVRALEGALIRVVAYASLRGEPATPSLARAGARAARRGRRRGLERLSEILDAAAAEFGVARARCSPATAARQSPWPARSRCSSRASSPTRACPRSAAASAAATTPPSSTPSTASAPAMRTDEAVRKAVDNLRTSTRPARA